MEKPNADIEWYDDGFSMEEQAKLRRDYLNERKGTMRVTTRFQSDSADALISDLRQKLAANEMYIAELEEYNNKEKVQAMIKVVEDDRDLWKERYRSLCNRYSADMQKILSVDETYQKQREQIKELKAEVTALKAVRDKLVYLVDK